MREENALKAGGDLMEDQYASLRVTYSRVKPIWDQFQTQL